MNSTFKCFFSVETSTECFEGKRIKRENIFKIFYVFIKVIFLQISNKIFDHNNPISSKGIYNIGASV